MRGGMKVLAVVAAAATALVLACQSGTEGTSAVGEECPGAMAVGYVPTVAALPLYVAAVRGYYAEEGVAVVLVPFSAAMDVDTALVGGSLSGALTDLFRVAYLLRKDSVPLVALRSTAERWLLVTCQSSRLSSPEQLRDKMIAMTRYSATDYLCDRLFPSSSSSPTVFKVQINDVALRRDMLEGGIMDAAWLPEPYCTLAAMAGHRVIYHSDSLRRHLGVLAVREGAEGADAMVRAYDRACDTINKYGLDAFGAELRALCNIDSATLHRLPPTRFPSHLAPDSATVTLAHRYVQHD